MDTDHECYRRTLQQLRTIKLHELTVRRKQNAPDCFVFIFKTLISLDSGESNTSVMRFLNFVFLIANLDSIQQDVFIHGFHLFQVFVFELQKICSTS